MSVTFVKGTAATGTAGATATWPASTGGVWAAGDWGVVIVGTKPATASSIATFGSGGGTQHYESTNGTPTGANVGDTSVIMRWAVMAGTEGGTTVAITDADDSVTWAQCYVLHSTLGWDSNVSQAWGKDDTAGTSYSAACAGDGAASWQSGDVLLSGSVIPMSSLPGAQWSAEAFAATGLTFDTIVEQSENTSGSGNNIGGVVVSARVASGTATGGPTVTFSATTGSNTYGPTLILGFREAAPLSGTSAVAPSVAVDTSGAAQGSVAVDPVATVATTGATSGSVAVAAAVAIATTGALIFTGTSAVAPSVSIETTGALGVPGTVDVSPDVAIVTTGATSSGVAVAPSVALATTGSPTGTAAVSPVVSLATTGRTSGSSAVTVAVTISTTGALIFTGTSAVAPSVTIETTGALIEPPLGTATNNRAGGRVRSGLGIASFDPALVALPAALVRGTSYPIAQAFGPVTMVGNQPHFSVTTARGVQTRRQILFGNKDITYLFGIPTPPLEFQTAQPFMYGPATLRLPQFANPQETVGGGRWEFLAKIDPETGKPRPGKSVRERVIRVSDGVVLKTTYRGVSTGFDTDGPNLTVQIGGQATGRMGLRDQQGPLFSSKQNPKRLIARVFESIGVPFDRSGAEPNFELGRFGDTGMLDYAQQIIARCWNTSGTQWTVMPNTDGVYEMTRRDTTTIHGTIYLDDARTSASLHRDLSEEPNRIFGRGTTPEGRRVHNGVYPGLVKINPIPPYPMDDGSVILLGTLSSDTDHGFAAMLTRLQTFGYLSRDDADNADGVYTQDIVDAVAEVQDEAQILPANGNLTEDTWAALFNVGVTGYSVWWSKIEPMASLRSVRQWKRTPDGAILAPNPTYDAGRLKVDRTIDFGAGFEIRQMRNFAKAELDAANDPNWTGTITLSLGAICRGDHEWGDPVDPMADWELDPGQNYKIVSSAGGELVVHCSGITRGDSPTQLTVDTRARDALPVWEVIRRNKESRGDLNRRAKNQSRSSTESKDVIQEMEEYGGRIDPVPVPGGAWKVFPVVAGKAGQIAEFRLRTRGAVGDAESDVAAPTRFVVGVFEGPIPAAYLQAHAPDPLNDKSPWFEEAFRDDLREKWGFPYYVGEPGALGGYFPKTQGTAGATITGRWEDPAGFSFRTGVQPILYVAYFGEDDSIIAGGRIMWNQEIVGS